MLTHLAISDFRNIEGAALEPAGGFNVFWGPNGSGKTSILEAVSLLATGRSFRQARIGALVRQGADRLQVVGVCRSAGVDQTIGLAHDGRSRRLRFEGREQRGVAAVAKALPVRGITPEVHDLVQGGPETRRRFLDWGLFHVEHGFHPVWQRFRHALEQRNRLLKDGHGGATLDTWDDAVAHYGEELHAYRAEYVARLVPRVSGVARALLPELEIGAAYRAGWAGDLGLAEALGAARERDRQLGRTTVGPHRGDLELYAAGARAADAISRGQEKLLAVSLIIAQLEVHFEATGAPCVLLFDDPASELDAERRGWLWRRLDALGTQVWLTATEADDLALEDAVISAPHQMFHVEHGRIHSAPAHSAARVTATG